MDETPAASVHEITGGRVRVVTNTAFEVADLHLTRGKEVDARRAPVANGLVTSNGSDGEHAEVGEVLEKRAVGSSDSKFHLGKLGQHAEETHLVLCHEHRLLQVWGLFSKLSEHIDFVLLITIIMLTLY